MHFKISIFLDFGWLVCWLAGQFNPPSFTPLVTRCQAPRWEKAKRREDSSKDGMLGVYYFWRRATWSNNMLCFYVTQNKNTFGLLSQKKDLPEPCISGKGLDLTPFPARPDCSKTLVEQWSDQEGRRTITKLLLFYYTLWNTFNCL